MVFISTSIQSTFYFYKCNLNPISVQTYFHIVNIWGKKQFSYYYNILHKRRFIAVCSKVMRILIAVICIIYFTIFFPPSLSGWCLFSKSVSCISFLEISFDNNNIVLMHILSFHKSEITLRYYIYIWRVFENVLRFFFIIC